MWVVYLLFLGSGATALVYQLAWSRELALIFGATHEAVSLVLGAFMAGLALGGWCFGRWTARLSRPLRAYGLLELGVGLSAVALPWLLRGVDAIYTGLALRYDGVTPALTAGRVVLAFATLLVPTFFMGASLPVLTEHVVRTPRDFAPRFSWLYAINTLGAVAGTLAGGLVLLPAVGMSATQMICAGINVGIGLLAVAIDRGHALPAAPTTTRDTPVEPLPSPARRASLTVAFYGTALTGACALALEVLWTRVLSIASGTTVYAFLTMLAAFLIGIAVGSALHGVLPLRRLPVAVKSGLAVALIGVTSLIVSRSLDGLPQLTLEWNDRLYGVTSHVRPATTLLVGFAVMLAPCLFMGMAFPMAGEARALLRQGFARAAGDCLSLNTTGAIVGALAAGFILIPNLGLHTSMTIVSFGLCGWGLLTLLVCTAENPSRLRVPVIAVMLLVAAAAFVWAWRTPAWERHTLATFRNDDIGALRRVNGRVDLAASTDDIDSLYYREGARSTVAVIQTRGRRSILVNAKSEASDYPSDRHTEYMLGHIPVLMHPQPRSVLVIALGAGMTLGAVAAHPNLEHIDLVEIEPAVLDGSRFFDHASGAPLDDPRVRTIIQDGRNHLKMTRRKYDVITSDPVHPWSAGAGYLFTREYYGLAAAALSRGGVMCQWLPLYELASVDLRSVIRSFGDNFAHTALFQTTSDAILIGSNAPLRVGLDDLTGRMSAPKVRSQLAAVAHDDPLAFLTQYVMDTAAMRAYGQGAPLNTDDNLFLEFSSARSIATPDFAANIVEVDAQRTSPAEILSPDDLARTADLLARYQPAASATLHVWADRQHADFDGSAAAYDKLVARLRETVANAPGYAPARWVLAAQEAALGVAYVGEQRDALALPCFARAVQSWPNDPEARLLLAESQTATGRAAAAVENFRAVLELAPNHFEARHRLAVLLLHMGRLDDAIRESQVIIDAAPPHSRNRANAYTALGTALARAGRTDEAIAALEQATAIRADTAESWSELARAYTAGQRYVDADAALRRAVQVDPTLRAALIQLAWMRATCSDDRFRDGAEAVRLAEQLNASRDPARAPHALDLLAAALAESGEFDRAIATAEQAIALARDANAAALVRQFERRLELYRNRRPVR